MLRAGNNRRRLREEEGGELAVWGPGVSEGVRGKEGPPISVSAGAVLGRKRFAEGKV